MAIEHARFVRLTGWMVLFSLLAGGVFSAGIALGQAQDSAPNTDATSILELEWANGVELLAGRQMPVDEGQYEWRITTLTAGPAPGDPIQTGRGVLIAVGGPMHVLVDDTALVELKAGAAMAIDDESEIVAVAVGETEVDYLVIELITAKDAERVATGETVELVGPVRVSGDGDYALVLLNLPVAVTIDVSPDQVIAGSVRPAVSIAHVGNEIPESLSDSRTYDRWIVALYPLAETAPTGSPATEAAPTSAPSRPATPAATPSPTATATATVTATVTATATETSTATLTPTVTATATVTSTPTDTPTATVTATPTDTPTTTPTSTATETPVPPTNTPTSIPTETPPPG